MKCRYAIRISPINLILCLEMFMIREQWGAYVLREGLICGKRILLESLKKRCDEEHEVLDLSSEIV